MQVVKKAFAHVGAVIRGMFFIGFTIQILLGLAWMCCNFGQVQDFGEPDTALYGVLFRLLGRSPQLMYLLQLGSAFLAGDLFLRSVWSSFAGERASRSGRERLWSLWRAFALLTYPFAMQCHMAIQPFSFMGSLFLVMLSFLLRSFCVRGAAAEAGEEGGCCAAAAAGSRRTADRSDTGICSGKEKACGQAGGRGLPSAMRVRRMTGNLVMAAVCAGGFILLSGAADGSGAEEPGRGIQAAMASRFAWPTIWYDQGSWTEDLREAVEDVLWEASYYPENMALLQSALEERVGREAAEAYYREMAEVAWRNHAPMIIRQIGWDLLGYTVTPVIFQLQLRGEAYDSYTGRNYEIMRGNTPVLTRNYVNYGCWWFASALLLSLPALAAAAVQGFPGPGRRLKALVCPVMICIICSGILVGVLTMRGAGLMDYKYTALISQLWVLPALFLAEEKEDSGHITGTVPGSL